MLDNKYGNHLFGKVAAHFKKKSLWFDIKHSNISMTLLPILVESGMVSNYILWDKPEGRQIRVFLKYTSLVLPVILPVSFYFKSGNKITIKLNTLKKMQDSLGDTLLVLSTSRGILTHKECLRLGISGYLYFIIYA